MIANAVKNPNLSISANNPAPLETKLTSCFTEGAFYIGRKNIKKKFPDTKWKNPFPVEDYTREKSLEHFEKYFLGEYDLLTHLTEYKKLNKVKGGLINQVEELRGKTLGCYCCKKVDEFIKADDPLICHGQFYLKALRGDYDYLTDPEELEPIAHLLAQVNSIDALHGLRQTYRPRWLKEAYVYGCNNQILSLEKIQLIRDWTTELNNPSPHLQKWLSGEFELVDEKTQTRYFWTVIEKPAQLPCGNLKTKWGQKLFQLNNIIQPKIDGFVALHVHSDGSLLDGLSQANNLAARAAELWQIAIAVTDHGVMHSAIALIKACAKYGIKAIIGNEMYLRCENTSQRLKEFAAALTGDYKPKKRYHQLVIALNRTGYENLCELTSLSWIEGKQGKDPTITKEQLLAHSDGVLVTSGCMAGIIPQSILAGDIDYAREQCIWYAENFPGRFYIELQDHQQEIDKQLNRQLVALAEELKLPCVITADNHYTYLHEKEAHDVLLCINTKKKLTDEKRMRYEGDFHLPSADELRERFSYLDSAVVEEALNNTVKIAQSVEDYKLFSDLQMPEFPVPEGYTADSYLTHLAQEGLNKRCKGDVPTDYTDRLNYELGILQSKGFSAYFLIVADYIQAARDRGIPVGPGRGSSAGSLVAYSTGITNIDPIKYGLSFERFLNPERKSPPDIDTDFGVEGRDQMIDYAIEKYGQDKVVRICTFNKLKSKSAVKDVARTLGISPKESAAVAKLIPVLRGNPTPLKVMVSAESPSPEFRQRYLNDPDFKRWIDLAMAIEGTNRNTGIHAAGVIMSPRKISQFIPLMLTKGEEVVSEDEESEIVKGDKVYVATQLPMEDAEQLGAMKMDFLGLSTLSVLAHAVKLIKQNQGIDVDLDEIDLEDPKVYQQFCKGETDGIFQFEGAGITQVCQDLQPQSIEDLAIISSLYRPGPKDAGVIPIYVQRKKGLEKVQYDLPELEAILKPTYGITVFQEQVLKIAIEICGYSVGEADDLRKAVGKKLADKMAAQKQKFIEGGSKRFPRPIIEKLWELIATFGGYGFNKSHAVAYSLIGYMCAWLKYYFPVEFLCAVLSYQNKQEKIAQYVQVAKRLKIEVGLPDINVSSSSFIPQGKKIIWGLRAIAGVGEAAADIILKTREDRPFESLAYFVERTGLGTSVVGVLIKAGAFDNLIPNRQSALRTQSKIEAWVKEKRKKEQKDSFGQLGLFDTQEFSTPAPEFVSVNEVSESEKLAWELEILGMYLSGHPLDKFPKGNSLDKVKKNQKVKLGAMITQVKEHTTKKMETMAFLKIQDKDRNELEAVLFADLHVKCSYLLEVNSAVWIEGKIQERDERLQVLIEDVSQEFLEDYLRDSSSFVDYEKIELPSTPF